VPKPGSSTVTQSNLPSHNSDALRSVRSPWVMLDCEIRSLKIRRGGSTPPLATNLFRVRTGDIGYRLLRTHSQHFVRYRGGRSVSLLPESGHTRRPGGEAPGPRAAGARGIADYRPGQREVRAFCGSQRHSARVLLPHEAVRRGRLAAANGGECRLARVVACLRRVAENVSRLFACRNGVQKRGPVY